MSGCLGRRIRVMDIKGSESRNMSAQSKADALWFAAKERREGLSCVTSSDFNEKILGLVEVEECILGVCKSLISRMQTLEDMVKILTQEILLMKIQKKSET